MTLETRTNLENSGGVDASGNDLPKTALRFLFDGGKKVGNSFWMVADQAVVSGTSFFSSFILARSCTKTEFGAYVLAVSIQISLREVQIGLVTSPMAFLGSTKDERQFSAYITPLILYQVLLAAAVSVIAWVAGGFYLDLRVSREFSAVAGAAASALFVAQAQEFFRRTLMTRLLFKNALLNDAVFSILQVGALSAILLSGHGGLIRPLLVFEVVTVSGLIASVFGYYQISRFIDGPLRWDTGPIWENWHFGKWNLATSGLVALYQQALYLTLGTVLGPTAVATVEAPRLLVAPFSVMTQGWNNWMAPSAGKILVQKGAAATQSFLNRSTLVLLLAVGMVLLPVMLMPNMLIGKVLGDQYTGDPWIVRMWCCSVLCVIVASGIPSILFLARLPRKLTVVRLVSSLVGLPTMLVLILLLGAKGAVASRLVVDVTQAIGAVVVTRRFLRTESILLPQTSGEPTPQAC